MRHGRSKASAGEREANGTSALPACDFGPLQAAAWAKSIVRFWEQCLGRGTIDPRRTFDIVDLAPQPDAMRLVLRELTAYANAAFGFRPRLRYIPCGRRSATDIVKLVDAGRFPEEANPAVVLAHRSWRHLPQRLLAAHYGSLLECDVDQLATGGGDASKHWRPLAMDSVRGDQLHRALQRCRARLNSSPLVLADAASSVIEAMSESCRNGYLVLSQDAGHVGDKQIRLCRFEDVLDAYRQDRALPVNFQLLAAQFQDLGALTWQRDLGGLRAVQAAVGGLRDPQPVLDAVIAPLRDDRLASGPWLAQSAGVVAARAEDADAVLALLRHSRHDPAVLLAACPSLHRRLSVERDRVRWAEALAAVWRNRCAAPLSARLYREVARAGMQVAQWGLARHALHWGIRRHGESADDLALLAWCEANTGETERSRALTDRALALEAGHLGAKDMLRRLQRRHAAIETSPWRQCVRHPTRPLLLEPLNADHAPALHHQYRDSQIALMTGLGSLPTIAHAQQWIEKRLGNRSHADFAVMHRDAGFVGHVGLRVLPPAASFCFWIGIDHQGKGFSSEAGRLLCSLAMSQGLDWVFASAYRDNLRSIRALERIGFQRVDSPSDSQEDQRVFMAYPNQPATLAMQALKAHQAREDLA